MFARRVQDVFVSALLFSPLLSAVRDFMCAAVNVSEIWNFSLRKSEAVNSIKICCQARLVDRKNAAEKTEFVFAAQRGAQAEQAGGMFSKKKEQHVNQVSKNRLICLPLRFLVYSAVCFHIFFVSRRQNNLASNPELTKKRNINKNNNNNNGIKWIPEKIRQAKALDRWENM